MKQFSKENFTSVEDIQIQVPTARLGFKLTMVDPGEFSRVTVRARLVGPNGTKTIIERMPLTTLLEVAAQNEGFYRLTTNATNVTIEGHVDIAKGGALALSSTTYLSIDFGHKDAVAIAAAEIHSMQHPNTVNTFLYYNPVTITQPLQNVQLDRAVAIVLPIAAISEIQLTYPSGNVSHTNRELRYIGDMSNDIVYVETSVLNKQTAVYGYAQSIILAVKDGVSGQDATRMQVESMPASGQYTIFLVEEKSL